MFSQRQRGFGLWRPPYNTPHTDGELQGGERSVRVTSWKNRCVPAESLKVDGDRGLLQDGEGWTPRKAPPINVRISHDLLPAAKFGGAKVPQPLRELVSRPPG
jgi:hypothetical protein